MTASYFFKTIMRPSKIIILLSVALLVFGPAAYFAYELFLKPSHFHLFSKKEKKIAQPLPPQEPGAAELDTATALQKTGKLQEARELLRGWLDAHADASKANEVRERLGKLNLEILCSPLPSAEKITYTVVKGDSLARIASRQKSNAELIQFVNNLPNINLQIGQELIIPQLAMTIELNRKERLLVLRDHDLFFKSYPLLSAPPSPTSKTPTPPLQSAVVDKMAILANKRIAFGDKKYPESERTILVRSGGNIVAVANEAIALGNGTATDANTSTTAATPMPLGFVLSTTDMKEVFPLVNKGTAIVIQ